jgi:hypothetical protein
LCAREEWPVFLNEGIISRRQYNRNAQFACQGSIETGFAKLLPIDEHACEGKTVDRVGKYSMPLRARVIAHQHYRVAAFLQPTHHAQHARLALNDPHPWIQLMRQYIAEAAMGVIDDDVSGAALKCSARRCICLCRHPAPRPLVFRIAGSHLLTMENSGYAFDISGNKNTHYRTGPPQLESDVGRPTRPRISPATVVAMSPHALMRIAIHGRCEITT